MARSPPAGWLQARGPEALAGLDLGLMFGAVPRPGDGLEALLVDRLIVDDAAAVRSVGDAAERETDIVEDARVLFVLGERLCFLLVLHAVVTAVAGGAVAGLLVFRSRARAP